MAVFSLACSYDTDTPAEEPGDFISYLPGSGRGGDGDLSVGGENDAGGDGDGDGAGAPSGDDGGADRVISEADIIQLQGTHLFALSQFSGLSIIDVSNPANLKIVGNYRSSATPFEMYLEGSTAYIMYNGWYQYVYDEDLQYSYYETTARMQAVDVSDPANPALLGDYEVPGNIVDSRKVGDVIYLATNEYSYCWRCDGVPKSRVASFDVSDPSEFSKVDELAFATEDDSWQRSISVSQNRIYVSGWTWDEGGGSIDVVDISDPAGGLVQGDTIAIAGQIQSRWQMDEYDGTLRVISQPGGWGTTNPPVVETFQINSSTDLDELAQLPMVLPRPENLRSVRFDGERAFAITFEQTDPLFTFDLSNPSAPLQVGELEIPGWVYHMEPRGDRVYGLGFDDTVDGGALHVSLFDVSDMANPTQIDRVNFGGDWGNFAEDQDRIHKAFNILSDEGLILVPFSGSDHDEESCTYEYMSGIQLIDTTTDSLTLRGVAPQIGSARRALMIDGTLFGVTDNAVQTFDISDRDSPEEVDHLDVARNVTTIKTLGSTMLRFGSDWWTSQSTLDIASLENVESTSALGELDLSELIGQSESYCENDGNYSYGHENWTGSVYVRGSYAYVPRQTYSGREERVGDDYKWTEETTITIFIIDISERTAPEVVGTFSLEPAINTGGKTYEQFGGIVQTDSALLVGRHKRTETVSLLGSGSMNTFSYDVVDLTGGDELRVATTLNLPKDYADGGWGRGFGGCSIDMDWGWWGGYYGGTNGALVSGDIVASQHGVPVSSDSDQIRYYLDRLDVSDPENPEILTPINIPGQVVHFDGEAGRLVTLEYMLETVPASSWEDCYEASGYQGYLDGAVCKIYRRRVNLVEIEGETARLIESITIDGELFAQSIAISDDRLFYSTVKYEENGPGEQKVHAIAISASGLESMGSVKIDSNGYYWGHMVARDGRAFLTQENEMTVIDATGSAPTAVVHQMNGWYCSSLEVADDMAYCAMGQFGVKAFSLD